MNEQGQQVGIWVEKPGAQQARFKRDIIEALRDGRLTLILGSGVSKQALSTRLRDNPIPVRLDYALESMSWPSLLSHGLEYLDDAGLNLSETEKESQARLKSKVASTSNPSLQDLLETAAFLRGILTRHHHIHEWFQLEFGKLYDDFIRTHHIPILEALGRLYHLGARIITTNYDDMLDRYIGKDPVRNDDLNSKRFFQKHNKNDYGIFHLHGVHYATNEAIFSDIDYDRILNDENVQSDLRGLIVGSEQVLFIGTGQGLDDPNFDNFLSWAKKTGQTMARLL
jgi:hypothetical protein